MKSSTETKPTNSPWRDHGVRPLLIARVLSCAGSFIQIVAAGWYVVDKTGSATSVGILAAMAFGPAVIGSPIGGWLADKYSLVKLTTRLSVLEAIPPLLIGVLIWNDTLTMPLLYLLIFLGAIPGGLNRTPMSLLPVAAASDDIRAAVVADAAITYNIARLIGPIVGSALVATVGPGATFALNGLSFLYAAFVCARTKLVEKPHFEPRGSQAKEGAKESYVGDIRRGMGFSVVRLALIGSLLFFGLVAPIQQLMPAIARTQGAHPLYLGILLSAIAAGGIVANPFVRRLMNRESTSAIVDIGLIIAGPSLLLLGLSQWLLVDLILLFILGMGWEGIWVASQSALQLHLPPDIRGHMLGVFYALVMLGTAAGAVLVGLLMDWIGTRNCLVAIGVLTCLYGITSLHRLIRHGLNLADSSPS